MSVGQKRAVLNGGCLGPCERMSKSPQGLCTVRAIIGHLPYPLPGPSVTAVTPAQGGSTPPARFLKAPMDVHLRVCLRWPEPVTARHPPALARAPACNAGVPVFPVSTCPATSPEWPRPDARSLPGSAAWATVG